MYKIPFFTTDFAFPDVLKLYQLYVYVKSKIEINSADAKIVLLIVCSFFFDYPYSADCFRLERRMGEEVRLLADFKERRKFICVFFADGWRWWWGGRLQFL